MEAYTGFDRFMISLWTILNMINGANIWLAF